MLLGPLRTAVLHFPEIYDDLVTSTAANRKLGTTIMNALLKPFLMAHEMDSEVKFVRVMSA